MNDKAKQAVKSLEDLKDSLSPDLWNKLIVELATNFMRNGEVDECVQVIGNVPPEYFKDKQLIHMLEDEVYRDNVIYLAYKFIQMGMVDVGYDISHTQKWGSA